MYLRGMFRALCVLFIAVAAHAEWKTIGNVTSVQKSRDGVELRTSTNALVSVSAVGDLGFRVRAAQGAAFGKGISWALDPKFAPAASQVGVQAQAGITV